MPSLAVQVSVQTGYFQIKKDEKDKESYLAFFHSKNRKKDRHKLNFKTRHWVRFFKKENYLLTSLSDIFKNSLSGGCETSYISLRIDNKNLFFLKDEPAEAYYFERQKDFLFSHLVWREKKELESLLEKRPRQFRKKWQEIKLKVEILGQWDNPAKLVAGYKENGRPKPTREGVGWNSPNYWEPKNRSLSALAFTHEIVLGKVEVPLLDLDPNKKDKEGNYKIKQAWLRRDLSEEGKKWKSLINKHQIPYYWKTATPGNSLLPVPYYLVGSMGGKKIYHQDTGQEIGDLLGKGDLVALPIGGDKNRQLVITEWGRKLVKKYGVKGILDKRFLVGGIEESVEEILNGIFLTLNRSNVPTIPTKKKPRIINQYLTKKQRENSLKLRQEIRAKVLSKYKTPLDKIWKVFYQDNQQKSGYFLVNDYQRAKEFDNLSIGTTANILLVNGYKHQFLSRILPP